MFKKQVLSVMAFTFILSAPAFARWTALAYDATTHKWGRAQCALSYADAVDTALANCGAGCQIVAYSRNGYVALATGASVWATGNLHGSQFEAEESSLSRCRERDPNCEIKVDGNALNCF